jgi:hypothetical protein
MRVRSMVSNSLRYLMSIIEISEGNDTYCLCRTSVRWSAVGC